MQKTFECIPPLKELMYNNSIKFNVTNISINIFKLELLKFKSNKKNLFENARNIIEKLKFVQGRNTLKIKDKI